MPIDLPPAPSVVILDDLPVRDGGDSITVDGKPTRSSKSAVATRWCPPTRRRIPARKAILDAIRALEDQRADIEDRIAALEGRQRFIEKMLETVPGGFGRALGSGTGGIEQWGDGLEGARRRSRCGCDGEAGAASARTARLSEQIDEKNKALDELPPPSDRLEVRIELAADAAASGELTRRLSHAVGLVGADLSRAALDRRRRRRAVARDHPPGGGNAADRRGLVRRGVDPVDGAAGRRHRRALSGSDAGPDAAIPIRGPSGYSMDQMVAAPPPAPRRVPSAGPSRKRSSLEGRPAVPIEAQADFGDFRAEYKVAGERVAGERDGARAPSAWRPRPASRSSRSAPCRC